MSPLTKAFVVLVTLLSILLVALVVPFVAKTDDLQQQLAEAKDATNSANAAAISANTQLAQIQSNISQEAKDLHDKISTLTSENLQLKQANAALEGAGKESSGQIDRLTATIAVQTQSLEKLGALLEDTNGRFNDAKEENLKLSRQSAELEQRNNTLDAQTAGLTRTVRVLREEITGLKEQMANAGSSTSSEGPSEPVGNVSVTGTITGKDNVEGVELVEINVGSNDDVRAGLKFVVYRGSDQYVATATVKSVDENVCVARVDSAEGSVAVGDRVLSGISY